jgi:hypothetical protein
MFSLLNNGRAAMKLIEKRGAVEIWEVRELHGSDFYVYGVFKDPKVCPSLGMAREVAAIR